MTNFENPEIKDFLNLMRKGLELKFYEGDVCEGESDCVIQIDNKGELSFFCEVDMGEEEEPLRVVPRRPFLLLDAEMTTPGENQIRFNVDRDDTVTLVFQKPRVRNYFVKMLSRIAFGEGLNE
jgi:hypothetical protein